MCCIDGIKRSHWSLLEVNVNVHANKWYWSFLNAYDFFEKFLVSGQILDACIRTSASLVNTTLPGSFIKISSIVCKILC